MNKQDRVRELKKVVSMVFKKLRRRGYLAKMKYWCCVNCATRNLLLEAAQKKAEGLVVGGIVHYNEQAEDTLWETGELYLNYCASDGTYGKEAVEVGQEICREFQKAGVDVEWDGSPKTTILLRAYQEQPPK